MGLGLRGFLRVLGVDRFCGLAELETDAESAENAALVGCGHLVFFGGGMMVNIDEMMVYSW
jgi:hypothetical protein